MDNTLKLRVMFDMIDNMTRPLKAVINGSKEMGRELKKTRDDLKKMGETQKNIGAFREIRTGLADTELKLEKAQARVKKLAGALREVGPPSLQMMQQFDHAKQAAARLSVEHEKQSGKVRELRSRLSEAGVSTQNLSRHERELRSSIAATSATMKDQLGKLDALAEREKRVAALRGKMHAMQGVAGGMAVGGYAARSAGMHVLGDMRETLDESKKVEIEAMKIRALGLGDHAAKDSEKYARAMKVYGTSTSDNILLMRDSLTIFADEHHAKMVMPTLTKMKFANDAMFGSEDGHANEEKFMNMLKVIELRGGTKDEATFKSEANMVQKVLTATGGRVGGDEWRNFIQTGGVAAKQMRKDAFFYQMEPLIQEMGGHAVGTGLMSAYNNIYQGKTTVKAARTLVGLDLIKKDGVEYNKMGQVNHFKTGALAGSDLLKASPLEWMEKVLLPKLQANGITDQDKIKDTIATIFTNRTAANLFTTMYMQRDQIHKNEKLNAGADGIEELNEKAKQTTQGRELAALAKIRDLKLEIGEKISPLYNAVLEKTAAAIDRINGFMKEHQTAARFILVTVSALMGLLVVVGTLTIALAGVLGPLAVVKFSMQTLGIQGGILSRVLGVGATALRIFGTAAMFAGRAMFANPIGLTVLAIVAVLAVAAFLIYRYWEPITRFFAGLWQEVKAAFSSGICAIAVLLVNWSPLGLFYRAFAGVLSWFGIDLPAKFTEFGANIMSGLASGITSAIDIVKNAIGGVADSTTGWFKEKLGIHSPSRVFGELGGFVGQGAALGIDGERSRVATAALGLATAAAVSFGTPVFAQQTATLRPDSMPVVRAAIPIDNRLALASAAPVRTASAPAQYVFNIYAAPGMDPAEIGRVVRAEIERIERAKQSRLGSRLSD
ncbi:phage tail tape measure protein [Paraburkholderia bonniea]|uniref:phage tail tape measure protein n=1 Tax=Paraburkholderia bonniea TaxID=2152891 RepID=UPI0012915F20|nr:hypothetical protein [Paraburkholderia bonniea]